MLANRPTQDLRAMDWCFRSWVGIMFIFLILVTYVPIISTFLTTALMGPEIITK